MALCEGGEVLAVDGFDDDDDDGGGDFDDADEPALDDAAAPLSGTACVRGIMAMTVIAARLKAR